MRPCGGFAGRPVRLTELEPVQLLSRQLGVSEKAVSAASVEGGNWIAP